MTLSSQVIDFKRSNLYIKNREQNYTLILCLSISLYHSMSMSPRSKCYMRKELKMAQNTKL